ncbi:22884_t:CDS:2, partial [Gigaspora margarita]
MNRQRNSYTIEKKRKVVELALRTSNSHIAQHYSLDLTMVGHPSPSYSQKNTQSIGSERHAFFSEEEIQLYEWIMIVRQNGLTVTYPNIKLKIAEILDKSSKKTENISKKLAIDKTKIAQKLLEDLKNQLLNFQRFVIRLRQKNDYPLEMIANMNETSVWFNIVGGLTVNLKGAKTVYIRTTGNNKNRFIIVLTCFANSKKLSPVFIFKGKGWPVNTPRPPAKPCNSRMMLVFDFFKAHITDQAKTEFRSGNTDLAVIPRGLMSMCQPLDYRWMANGGNDITKKENLKRARLNMAFKKYGISNCLSGSEDHLIYDNKSDEGKIEDFDEEEFDEDNEDKDFDEVDEVEESDKNEESDNCNESNSDEFDYRVG